MACWDIMMDVIPKQKGLQWLQEMIFIVTAQPINSRMTVWAVLQTPYQHGQGLQDWLSHHEQTVNAIANVVDIWLMDSPAFAVEYDSGYVGFI
jgi:hypothetical protein